MIEIVKGKVVAKGENYLVIQTGMLGLKVWVPIPLSASLQIGENVQLYTDLILRETDINLFGFHEIKTRDFFRTIIKVNGVGPKAALSILSTLTIQSIYHAVQMKDARVFTSAPGIGNKTAQKIILYLEDALAPLAEGIGFEPPPSFDTELLDALIALGYSVPEAQASIQSLPKDLEENLESRLRVALQYFSK